MMPMRWSYLGHLGPDGTLNWGGSYSDNISASGHILPDNNDTKVYLKIREHARAGRFEGAQVDWGAYAIKVNGPELLSILQECYGNPEAADPTSLLGQYVAYAQELGADQYVAFLSVEL